MGHWLPTSCKCGSGRSYECCCQHFDDTTSDTDTQEAGAYLAWGDLWPCDVVDLDALLDALRPLDGEDVTYAVARIQWMLREELRSESTEQELLVCDAWLDSNEARKIRAWVVSKKRHKIIHRLNCLGLQQANLLLGRRHTVSGGDETIANAMRCLIRTNDVLALSDEAAADKAADTVEHVAAMLTRTFFYSHREELGPAFGRYWAIFQLGMAAVTSRNTKVAFDMEGTYREAYGLSLSQMLALGLGTLSYYRGLSNDALNRNPSLFIMGAAFFSGLKNAETVKAIPAFLRYMGRTWREHSAAVQKRTAKDRGNLFQHGGLYRWPLVLDEDGGAYLIDEEFLSAQATEGAMWGLLEWLAEHGRRADGDKLLESMGHAFEWYAAQVVGGLHRPECGTAVWTGWDDQIGEVKGVSTPDLLIQDGVTLYVVELTTAGVAPSVAIEGSGSRLRESLKRLWAGDEAASNKMRQLESAWRAGLEHRLRADGLVWETVKHVRPLFVSLRDMPQHLGLVPLYRDVMLAGGCTPEFVDRVSILGVSDLEAACALRRGGTMWDDLWRDWESAEPRYRSLQDFLRRGRRLDGVEVAGKRFVDEGMSEMKRLLFEA